MDDWDDEEWLAQQGWGSRAKEPMRGRTKVRTNPSPEDRKVRNRNRRTTAGGDVQKRAELVRALGSTKSFSEQARLLDEIAKIDAGLTAQAAQGRELDFANTAVQAAMTPVRVHERHTEATDWLSTVAGTVDTQWQNQVVAEAAMWFGRVPDFVKADAEEFGIQAHGMARRVAGPYGLQMEAAAKTFVDYVGFLRTQSASGLDQIQQTVDPHDNPKTTELPTEVFDNFAPEVDPINAGVSGTEDSNRAPVIQEIMQGGSAGNPGAPEKPGGHSTQDELSWNPPQGMQQDSTPPLNFAQGPSNANPPAAPNRSYGSLSPAIGYTTNMDEYRAKIQAQAARTVKAAESLGKCTGCGKDLTVANAADREGKVCKGCAKGSKTSSKKEAASGLDQIQQTVDPHDNPKPTGLPPEVAFPLDPEFEEEWTTNGTGQAQPKGKAAKKVQADMFGGGDAPHPTVGPANTNDPTPTPRADAAGGAAAGRADAQAGNKPSFADSSSHIPPAAQQYAEGYGDAARAQVDSVPKNVPPSMTAAKVSHLIVTAAELENADFKKGYGYGSRWTPGTRLVSTGSKEFEAGLYAGISDNPENQKAFVEAHRTAGEKFPGLTARADQHKRVTARVVAKNEVPSNGLYLVAATSIEMNTTAPNTTPAADGSTPINGPGRPGPLNGLQEAAAPGGPSPYNGAEPFGTPVVPGVGQSPASPADALIGGGHMSTQNQVMGKQALAFRQRVQAGLLAERQGK